jgi:hypothetical protein
MQLVALLVAAALVVKLWPVIVGIVAVVVAVYWAGGRPLGMLSVSRLSGADWPRSRPALTSSTLG